MCCTGLKYNERLNKDPDIRYSCHKLYYGEPILMCGIKNKEKALLAGKLADIHLLVCGLVTVKN